MAKIPFDIKYRPQIESGEYKVETFSGYPVTIYRWDFNDGTQTPIMGSYAFKDGKEYGGAWNEEGHFDLMSPNDLDLFIITPEPELSEFEMAIHRRLNLVNGENLSATELLEETKGMATELLTIARKQLIEERYTSDPRKTGLYKLGKAEALKEFEEKYKQSEFNEEKTGRRFKELIEDERYQWGINDGIKEALKHLPKWKKVGRGDNYSTKTKFTIYGRYLEMNDTLNDVYEVPLSTLENLPRFEED